METKKELRTQILNIRNSLDSTDKNIMDERLASKLLNSQKIIEASAILVFVSYGSEVDTINIIKKLIDDNKFVYAPKVVGEDMLFYQISSVNDLKAGYKGILEPKSNGIPYEPGHGDVILVPGSVFDTNLFRIGYGKGFYDRYLAKYRGLYSIGLGYDFQLVSKIPIDEWDRSLDMLITEKEVYRYDGSY